MRTLLPGRTDSQIENRAAYLDLHRPKRKKLTSEELTARKRDGMARHRAANPDVIRETARRTYYKHRDRRLELAKTVRVQRFFAQKAYGLEAVTTKDLARIWKRQRGRCALSGRRLDRSAEVDHIFPRSRGGTDALENLQWLSREVNRAKREMIEADFIAMCQEIAGWAYKPH